MSKKFYLITIVITLAIAAVIVTIFVLYKNKIQQSSVPESTINQTGNYANLPIGELVKRDKLDINTNKGTVKINNVYKESKKALSNNGVAFEDNNDFYIAFYPDDNSFIIAILNPDVKKARLEAEGNFLDTLGIDKNQACELNVILSIPYDVNAELSGKNYGLSFCPNGISF